MAAQARCETEAEAIWDDRQGMSPATLTSFLTVHAVTSEPAAVFSHPAG